MITIKENAEEIIKIIKAMENQDFSAEELQEISKCLYKTQPCKELVICRINSGHNNSIQKQKPNGRKRMSVTMEPDVAKHLHIMARLNGMSITEYLNTLIRADMPRRQ